MNFEILETARHELDEAITYYNRQQPELGDVGSVSICGIQAAS